MGPLTRFSRRTRVTLVVALLALITGFIARAKLTGSTPGIVPPARDSYVGQPEDEVLRRLGPPSGTFDGHYGLVSMEHAKRYDPARTHTYVYPLGTLYVSVYRTDNAWVCFSSDWLPVGAAY